MPAQSLHNSTGNFRVHACVTFLVKADKRPLLMGCCLKRLETSPFHWRWFCRCAINRLGHAFPQTRYIFTNGAPIPTICLAWSFADAMLSSGNFGETFSCFMSFAHAQSTSKRKSEYFCLLCMCTASKSGFSKFQHKSLSYSLKKSERPCVFFHSWENPELSRSYPYFRNALLILMIFCNKYGTAVTVGMYD